MNLCNYYICLWPMGPLSIQSLFKKGSCQHNSKFTFSPNFSLLQIKSYLGVWFWEAKIISLVLRGLLYSCITFSMCTSSLDPPFTLFQICETESLQLTEETELSFIVRAYPFPLLIEPTLALSFFLSSKGFTFSAIYFYLLLFILLL